jgi:hypothetical protein
LLRAPDEQQPAVVVAYDATDAGDGHTAKGRSAPPANRGRRHP